MSGGAQERDRTFRERSSRYWAVGIASNPSLPCRSFRSRGDFAMAAKKYVCVMPGFEATVGVPPTHTIALYPGVGYEVNRTIDSRVEGLYYL